MNMIPTITPVELRVSQIVYHCDVSTMQGLEIPLGVLVTIKCGVWFGLGLQARLHVEKEELEQVGSLAKKLIGDPFAMLEREFQRVWQSFDIEAAFDNLSREHSSSLRFSAPSGSRSQLPTPLVKNQNDEAMKEYLSGTLNNKAHAVFWTLMEESKFASSSRTESEFRVLAA